MTEELPAEIDEDQDELTGSYTFEQLSPRAQENARRDYTSGDYPHDEWWDSSYEDFIEIAKRLGIEITTHSIKLVNGAERQDPDIWFSGFSSQGDGASFEGCYRYNQTAIEDIAEHANDPELKRIAEALTALNVATSLEYGGTLKAHIGVDRGSYSHSGTMKMAEIDLDGFRDEEAADCWLGSDTPDDALLALFRNLADWMYRQLNEAYDWYFTPECVDEALTDGRLFDGDGEAII